MNVTVMTAPQQLSPPCDQRVAGLRVLLPYKHKAIVFRDHLKGTECITIGRVDQRDVRLRHESVSKFHCIVERIRPTTRGAAEQFRIIDCDSKNGVFISSFGRYGELHEVSDNAGAILHLGMLIQVGRVVLTPMNAAGECLVVVARHSEYAREVTTCYGSPNAAHEHTGAPRRFLARVFDSLRARFSRSDAA